MKFVSSRLRSAYARNLELTLRFWAPRCGVACSTERARVCGSRARTEAGVARKSSVAETRCGLAATNVANGVNIVPDASRWPVTVPLSAVVVSPQYGSLGSLGW